MGKARFEIKVEGLKEAVDWLDKLPRAMMLDLAEVVDESAAVIFKESQKLVPVGGPPTSPRDPHPGELKASGRVGTAVPNARRGEVEISISYGAEGLSEPYAFRQHEDLTYRHKPGQTAKYLERPILDEADRLNDRIVRKLGSWERGNGR
jgi:hypothetical protein